jgi:signal transduction histidine kinase
VPAWLFHPSRRAFVPVVALVGAAFVGTAGIFGALYEDQVYRAQRLNEVTSQADILAASVTAALAFNDNKTAQQYTNALEANPELDRAVVYDQRGHIVAEFARRGSGAPPQDPALTPAQVVGDHVELVIPVAEAGSVLGKVYMSGTMDSLERRIVEYGVIAFVAAMAALLLAVMGAAQWVLFKANKQLESHARTLAEANVALQNEMRERGRVEEALRQSQKMEAVGQLSSGIAHDFNNFLMIIKGNLHLLRRRMAQGRTDVQRYIDGALAGVDHAASVTQRVLAFSRQQPLEPEQNNLNDLVRGALQLVRQSVDERIEIDTRLESSWWVYCDTHQMQNVILNLAINARDAMQDGGRLTIGTKDVRIEETTPDIADILPGDYVELRVRDSGAGMTDDVRAKALDPFFTTKPHGKGTGLGLSTTFGYVRQSGGYLDIESTVGKGTIIRILMPRRHGNPISGSA